MYYYFNDGTTMNDDDFGLIDDDYATYDDDFSVCDDERDGLTPGEAEEYEKECELYTRLKSKLRFELTWNEFEKYTKPIKYQE